MLEESGEDGQAAYYYSDCYFCETGLLSVYSLEVARGFGGHDAYAQSPILSMSS